MPDHQQAAIEAARTAWDAHFFGPTRNEFDEITCAECGYAFGWDGLENGPRGDRALNHAFDQALAAAEPHLRAKWAEEIREKVNPPDVDYSHEWRRGFTVGAIKAARFVEGAGE